MTNPDEQRQQQLALDRAIEMWMNFFGPGYSGLVREAKRMRAAFVDWRPTGTEREGRNRWAELYPATAKLIEVHEEAAKQVGEQL